MKMTLAKFVTEKQFLKLIKCKCLKLPDSENACMTLMAYSDRTYVGMEPGPGPGLIQCQSIGPI